MENASSSEKYNALFICMDCYVVCKRETKALGSKCLAQGHAIGYCQYLMGLALSKSVT